MSISKVGLLLIAYLIGSIPTALIVSRQIARVDIRLLGDGNIGARNTQHVLGWRAGFIVAWVDFSKGVGIILLARIMQMNLTWQLLAGGVTVLGHDFPVFADFKGGQGMATSLGTMSMLFLEETLIGLICFGLIYLISRQFDLSAAGGLALVVFLLVRNLKSFSLLTYTLALLLTIPIKKFWDAKHRLAGSI